MKDKTAQVITDMLVENTGSHFLDSGGAYGRNYSRNQGKDFETEPRAEADWKYKTFTISLYHFLNEVCVYNEKLDRIFNTFARRKENADESWLGLAEKFPTFLQKKGIKVAGMYGESNPFTVNTYNGEDALSQVIQYTYFEIDRTPYVVLSIHGGCDVRGGYTKPRIFEVDDNTGKTIFDNARISLYCDHCKVIYDSEDGGSNWDCNNPGNTEDPNQLVMGCIGKPSYRDLEHKHEILLKEAFETEDNEYDGLCPICKQATLTVGF